MEKESGKLQTVIVTLPTIVALLYKSVVNFYVM